MLDLKKTVHSQKYVGRARAINRLNIEYSMEKRITAPLIKIKQSVISPPSALLTYFTFYIKPKILILD